MQELSPENETIQKCDNCTALKLENADLKQQLAEMEQRAHHDPLTRIANRRYFIESLEHRITRCQRYGDVSALMFLDVNNLKQVNDGHGHGAGDALLIRLSQILSSNVRASDLVARIGGDEFAILLDNLDADQVDSKIAFLMERIDQSHAEFEGKAIPLGAAIGYCFVGPKDDVNGLMSKADAAMYEAKRSSV